MSEVILDTLIDSIKLVPFLFLTYLAMEYLEHKAGEKTTHMVRKAGKMLSLIHISFHRRFYILSAVPKNLHFHFTTIQNTIPNSLFNFYILLLYLS